MPRGDGGHDDQQKCSDCKKESENKPDCLVLRDRFFFYTFSDMVTARFFASAMSWKEVFDKFKLAVGYCYVLG